MKNKLDNFLLGAYSHKSDRRLSQKNNITLGEHVAEI